MKDQIIKFSRLIQANIIMRSIRHALLITIPVLMVGSFACLFQSFPIAAYQDFITTFAGGIIYEFFAIIYCACFHFFSIFIVINVSLCYIIERTTSIEECITVPAVALGGFFIFSGAGTDTFDITVLSVSNTFVAVLSSISISVLLHYMQNSNKIYVKTGASGGLMYNKAISMIAPSAIVLAGCTLFTIVFRAVTGVNNLPDLMTILGNRIVHLTNNNFLKGITYLLLVQIFWFFGLHGGNIMEGVAKQSFITVSAESIFNKTFYDTYVNIGGCGTAICIVIAICLCSKYESTRSIAKGAAVPIICNINELVTFGFPVVFNPIMGIPFLIVPIVNYIVAYAATAMQLVPQVVRQVEWTTPVFLSGYYSTGSIAGSVLQLVCIVIGVLIYMPFIKMHERLIDNIFMERTDSLVDLLKKSEADNTVPNFIERNDIYASTAKSLLANLEHSIKNKSLYMVYQPQVDNDGKCIGAEALIRWEHRAVGHIYPPLIIELAKEGNILDKLEAYIFDDVCSVAKKATEYLGDETKISINITASSLQRDSIAEEIKEAAARYDLDPHCIWVEITENEVLSNTDEVVKQLQKLKESGHHLLIDDFSMGNTSLKYLNTECFDGIKLDASITQNIKKNYIGQEIVTALTDMGKRLDIDIIAECVEEESQKKVLESLGCDYYQGYFYSKPLTADKFIEYIK